MPAAADRTYWLGTDVAELLHVSPKTVSRWAKDGKLPHVRTLGGHRRYDPAEILALYDTLREDPTVEAPA
jgi:excisionase family DNA binding protein